VPAPRSPLRVLKTGLLVSSMALALSGCALAVGPDFERPAAPNVSSYTAEPMPAETVSAPIVGGDAQKFLEGGDVAADWWKAFGSETLNALVEHALAANADLGAARAALRQAEETYLASMGPLLPSVSASGSANRQEVALNNGGPNAGSTYNLYNASVGVSYSLDIFGGIRRSVEAQRASSQFTRFQLEATYLTLIGNVLTASIQQASLSEQVAATEDIIKGQRQTLDLLNQQYELGAVARGDVLSQQAQLAQTEATLPPLQKQLSIVRNQLSVLMGRFPSEGQIPRLTLADLTLPQDLPVSVPSRIVEQRPDIRASEALLHQATAQVGIATANMLPQITLSANYGGSTNSLPGAADIFDPSAMAWNLIGGVTQPIFRGGQLLHQRKASVANLDRASEQYRGTVLTAFANVANVLRALELDAQALKAQLDAERSAAESLTITRERFRAGAISSLALIDAERTYQQAKINLVQAQAIRYADTVALFQALGGGWWNRANQDIAQNTTSTITSTP